MLDACHAETTDLYECFDLPGTHSDDQSRRGSPGLMVVRGMFVKCFPFWNFHESRRLHYKSSKFELESQQSTSTRTRRVFHTLNQLLTLCLSTCIQSIYSEPATE